MEKVKQVKQEIVEPSRPKFTEASPLPPVLIDLDTTESDSGSDSSSSSSGGGGKRSRSSNRGGRYELKKRKKSDRSGVVLPVGFLAPLHPKEVRQAAVAEPPLAVVPHAVANGNGTMVPAIGKCKQFWKAGDYEGSGTGNWVSTTGGMDRVRVHPRFLHSNATSHKWVLGAFAELLDNSLDEALNGATCVNIDMMESNKDGSRMLLIEDNGGGMDPDKMRQCMSLGYSLKSKVANTIGQYGNGFKTSTMRLGADVIVFSRCNGPAGKRPTQSIGLLSYTFLRSTGLEDIVVPMLDYERVGLVWNEMIRSTPAEWDRNVQTILEWSPFSSEAELSRQFDQMKNQGTRIIIYNLWEDDQGLLELDFDSDKHDIQIRGVNRDEKNIKMAQQYPNSRHFLTYRHSLRSYASILYLRIPPGFRIILRGKDVDHHNVVNDMMFTQEVTYRPQPSIDVIQKDSSVVAVITMGFVKDATAHIDVQGYNVYHKNRLIKPFWRVWNAAGSDGRGVIGVLEADFVEPAHDKQGFERTIVLSRLETKLIQLQKQYWSTNCHKIGYAARGRNKKFIESRETSPEDIPQVASHHKKSRNVESGKAAFLDSLRKYSHKSGGKEGERHLKTADKGHNNGECGKKPPLKSGKKQSHLERTSIFTKDIGDNDMHNATSERQANGGFHRADLSSKKSSRSDGFPRVQSPTCSEHSDAKPACSSDGRADRVDTQLQSKSVCSSGGRADRVNTHLQSKGGDANVNGTSPSNDDSHTLDLLKEENRELKIRLKREKAISENVRHELHTERDEKASLEAKLDVAMRRIEAMNKEQESLIDIFSEERERRDIEEENLRKKLKDASNEIRELLDKVRLLEKAKSFPGKSN